MPVAPVPVVLATSNGVGMGHLTRQLSVALAGSATLDVTLLSLSGALPTVARAAADGRLPGAERVRFEHCASRTSPWQGRGASLVAWRTAWDAYFADRLRALVAETGARVVAYDGVVPYAGLLAARRSLPGTAFAWVRRGLWQDGVGAAWLARASCFDQVVEPGDVAGQHGPTVGERDVLRTAPVSLTAHLPPAGRAEARASLGLDPDRPALLLSPGSGAYADVSTLVRRVVALLGARGPHWQVAVTRQAIARHDGVGDTAAGPRVVTLQGVYPLSRSLAAFDAAVGAAGYNTVHEHAAVGLPTLLVPSTAHETDDQVHRARALAAAGAALVAEDDAALDAGVERLLDPGVRADLAAACARLPAPGGAHEIAAELARLGAGRRAPARPTRLGPAPLRRWASLPLARRRGPAPLTTDLDEVDALGPRPVEHVVPGASEAYRAQRARIARHLYA